MYYLSERSNKNLMTCHYDLVRVVEEVLETHDLTVVEGHRSNQEQQAAFNRGASKLQAGKSKHNLFPSMAVDIVPFPIDWEDMNRFYYFSGIVRGVSESMGIRLRWGGDWDSDNVLSDHQFVDLPHWELVDTSFRVEGIESDKTLMA